MGSVVDIIDVPQASLDCDSCANRKTCPLKIDGCGGWLYLSAGAKAKAQHDGKDHIDDVLEAQRKGVVSKP